MLIINLFSSSVNIFGCSWMFVVLLTVYFLLFMVDIGEHHGDEQHTAGGFVYGLGRILLATLFLQLQAYSQDGTLLVVCRIFH